MSPSSLPLAFAEGLALIVSPCILPILPIVLSASVTGSRLRPIGIIIGFVLSFTAFTLFSRQLVLALHVDPTVLRQVAFVFLLGVGLTLLIPQLGDWFARATAGLATSGNRLTQKSSGNDLLAGVLVGAGIGLVWVPCSGPILAAVIVQSVTETTTLGSILTVVLFALGAALPMSLIALGGQSIMKRFNLLKTHGETLRRVLGGVILATVLFSAQDTLFPALNLNRPAIADAAAEKQALQLEDGLKTPYPAPKIEGIAKWYNGQPSLKGKVVLVDFWTYSCINCVRTLPHLVQWNQRYAKDGLVIVGVHAPEFEFEKNPANVQQAIAKHGIRYPVALDNDFRTWKNFGNQYWPAHYLIDRDGRVVFTHFGEGKYDVTENNIRYLLGLKGKTAAAGEAGPGGSLFQSPETYLGYARAANFSGNPELAPDRAAKYNYPDQLALNHWALSGAWKDTGEFAETSAANAALRYNFYSKKVYLVLATATGKPITVDVRVDGKPVGAKGGQSVVKSTVTVQQNTLYELVRLPNAGSGVLEIVARSPGLRAYAFTFGG